MIGPCMKGRNWKRLRNMSLKYDWRMYDVSVWHHSDVTWWRHQVTSGDDVILWRHSDVTLTSVWRHFYYITKWYNLNYITLLYNRSDVRLTSEWRQSDVRGWRHHLTSPDDVIRWRQSDVRRWRHTSSNHI